MRQFQNTVTIAFKNWRKDGDGMLRVTARVLSEGVFKYLPEESPDDSQVLNGYVPHYIPRKEFTREALRTLEGKPVIAGTHEWRTPSNTNHDGLTVGSVAGTPRIEGKYVVADLLITDKRAIDQIEKGELVEISAGYSGDCVAETGVLGGEQYTASQHNLRFNHLLLLPKGAGRCGQDVRIINNKSHKETTMAKTLQRQFGNRRVDYTFQNEDDAKEAERMVEDQKTFNGEELEAAMAAAEELKGQITELQKKYDENLKVIEEQKARIDDLMSAETQSAMADEAAAQAEAEDAVLEDAVENEDVTAEEKEEIKNKLCNAKTFAARRAIVVQNALSISPEQFKNWNQDAVDGAFETLAAKAQKRLQNAKKSLMGGNSAKLQNAGMTNLERVLRPMRLSNRKTTDGRKE